MAVKKLLRQDIDDQDLRLFEQEFSVLKYAWCHGKGTMATVAMNIIYMLLVL